MEPILKRNETEQPLGEDLGDLEEAGLRAGQRRLVWPRIRRPWKLRVPRVLGLRAGAPRVGRVHAH